MAGDGIGRRWGGVWQVMGWEDEGGRSVEGDGIGRGERSVGGDGIGRRGGVWKVMG